MSRTHNKVKVVFYKGKGNIINWLIRKWTRSEYSHCEIVLNENDCYSSSARDGGVRHKVIDISNTEKWDVLEIEWVNGFLVMDYFKKTNHLTYGWKGLLLGQLFNIRYDVDTSDFCSEWCAAALGIPNAQSLSPQTLYNLLVMMNKLYEHKNPVNTI